MISEWEGKQLAEKYNIDFIEVSAKLNYNIDQPFHILGEKIIE